MLIVDNMKLFKKKKKQIIEEKVDDEIWRTTDNEQYMIEEALKGNLKPIQSHCRKTKHDNAKPTKKSIKKKKIEHIEKIKGVPLRL